MKAVVLSAGKGTRLYPLTETVPKPMLPVRGKPVLEHNIELLKRHGVDEICINLHHKPEVIRDYFGNGEKWGVRIHYSFEPELLGTAGAVKGFETILGKSPFFVIYGDNFTDYDLSKMQRFHEEKKGVATIAVFEKEDVRSSGVLWIDKDGKVMKFIEKPKDLVVDSKLVNAGIYILDAEVFSWIPRGKFSDFGLDVFPALLQAQKALYAIPMKGILEGIDTVALYDNVKQSYGS